MCGIFGAVEWEQELNVRRVVRATDCLSHRGPDESGFLFDHTARSEIPGRSCRFLGKARNGAWQIGLGHRRLAILDLATGQQPMLDASGAWSLIFNGEIYNHQELRTKLAADGATFLTDHSDTETFLLAFARWGPSVLAQLNGMVAAAIYHRDSARLWLIRDRFGKKPIYLHHAGGRIAFASELKALIDYLGGTPALDTNALGDYMMRGCIHEPRTIFQTITKVPAAACVEFDLSTAGGRLVSQSRYWEFEPPEAVNGSRSEADWLAELEHLLDDAVKIRLLSDVPVGAFLSSGIDSATVCALAAQHVTEPLRAFTISTGEAASDEAADAAQVAASLGLRHVSEKCRLEPDSLLNELVTAFDEPFSDLSMAPTLHVARLAAREVKVVLTGDGADEFFAGYSIFRYMMTRTALERVPTLGTIARGVLRWMPPGARGGAFIARNFRPKGLARYQLQIESPALLRLLQPDLAEQIEPGWPRLEALWQRGKHFDDLLRVSLLQGMTYLTDDILVKVDRATMAHSLEARAPFLDYRVVELAGRMPSSLKFANGHGKLILRRLAARWFPESYLNKPKRGFIVPLKDWMRNDIADELDGLAQCDLLAARQVERLVSLQRKTQRDYSPVLWRLLVLSRWLRKWNPPVPRREANGQEMASFPGASRRQFSKAAPGSSARASSKNLP